MLVGEGRVIQPTTVAVSATLTLPEVITRLVRGEPVILPAMLGLVASPLRASLRLIGGFILIISVLGVRVRLFKLLLSTGRLRYWEGRWEDEDHDCALYALRIGQDVMWTA